MITWKKGKKIYGTQTFDQSVIELYNQGLISYEDALAYASNPSDVELKLKGIGGEDDESGFTY